jgi:hypothetical protein
MPNIENYNWSDARVAAIEAQEDFITITTTSSGKLIDINESDAIHIAQHFNLLKEGVLFTSKWKEVCDA